MASKKKLLQAAAGSAGGAGLDVDEVFSTFLIDGNGSTQAINNGLDLSGEGGLVWIKNRDDVGSSNVLYDTVRPLVSGNISRLITNSNNAVTEGSNELNSFNNNGFTLGGSYNTNSSSYDYVSWTFRKAPKFFDVVTWTGDGLTGRSISHNLGGTPGFIAIKALDSVSGSSGDGSWLCCARKSDGSYAVGDGTSSTSTYGFGFNKDTQSYGTTSSSNAATHITDSAFSIQYVTGDGSGTQYLGNTSGKNYVAYLFAHNNSDGEFGPDSDQDIIKCGSYTGNGSASGPTVNLGFEPQWIMIKDTTAANYWMIFDVMRGLPSGVANSAATLKPNGTDAEFDAFGIDLSASGFQITDSNGIINDNGNTYIYMAIRRGPLAAPEDATKVFEPVAYTGDGTNGRAIGSISRADLVLVDDRNNDSDLSSYGATVFDRLRGAKALKTSSTNADEGGWTTGYIGLDQSNGWRTGDSNSSYLNKSSSTYISWTWKRAPSYFDVVAYSAGSGADTISHNLGVAPEMIWVKNRDTQTVAARGNWVVYHASVSNGYLNLHDTVALQTADAASKFGNGSSLVAPTSSAFTVADDYDIGRNNNNYIAYLFATVAGVSKVGSVSHTSGSATNVDCGFSSGARFVLIKQTDDTGAWYVFDSVRGIIPENDAGLYLNVTTAQQSADWIDPLASGFTMTSGAWNTGTYIFYAIA